MPDLANIDARLAELSRMKPPLDSDDHIDQAARAVWDVRFERLMDERARLTRDRQSSPR